MSKVKVVVISMLLSILCAGCATYFKPHRESVLSANNQRSFVLMDFSHRIQTNPIEPGWYQFKFDKQDQDLKGIEFTTRDKKSVAKLWSQSSRSSLYREVDVDISRYPILSWDWYIEKGISSNENERLNSGDDHPARILLSFSTDNDEHRELELVWGNKISQQVVYKIDEQAYFVVRGGPMTNRWFSESVNIMKLYRKIWPYDGNPRLTDVGIASDSDQTAQSTVAYISSPIVQKRGDEKKH